MIASAAWLIWFNTLFIGEQITDNTSILEALDEGAGANDAQQLARESLSGLSLDEGSGQAEAQKALLAVKGLQNSLLLQPGVVDYNSRLKALENLVASQVSPVNYDSAIRNLKREIALLAFPSGISSGSNSSGVTALQLANSGWLTGVAGTNTVTGSTVTPFTVLSPGLLVWLIPANTNTSAVTLNVNGTGAKPVTKNGITALIAGDFTAGTAYLLLWDGTEWQILSSATSSAAQTITSFTPSVFLGSTAVTSYALRTGICIQTGKQVTVLLSISIDTLGAGTGNVTIVLPSSLPTCQNTGTGCFGSLSAFAALTSTPTAEIDATTLTVQLFQTGSTGSAPLTNANLTGGTPGSTFTLTLNYESF